MTHDRLAEINSSVLDRMERADKLARAAIMAAVVFEAALMAVALYLVDWTDHLQRLLFIFSILSYTIIAMGLLAIAAHVTKTVSRVLAALEVRT